MRIFVTRKKCASSFPIFYVPAMSCKQNFQGSNIYSQQLRRAKRACHFRHKSVTSKEFGAVGASHESQLGLVQIKRCQLQHSISESSSSELSYLFTSQQWFASVIWHKAVWPEEPKPRGRETECEFFSI